MKTDVDIFVYKNKIHFLVQKNKFHSCLQGSQSLFNKQLAIPLIEIIDTIIPKVIPTLHKKLVAHLRLIKKMDLKR